MKSIEAVAGARDRRSSVARDFVLLALNTFVAPLFPIFAHVWPDEAGV